jgi:hypothetical protein
MPRKATKAADNIYYKARIEAASTNDKLNSREGASEVIGIDRTRLAHIELDSIRPYPEEVLMMSDVYNAPELNNYFCCEQCPIGKHSIPHLEILEIDRVTLQVLASLKNIDDVRVTLLDIVADGIITEEEKPKLKYIIDSLEKVSVEAQELKLWAQKNLK